MVDKRIEPCQDEHILGIHNRRNQHQQWNLGDVYAYHLESNLAKEKGLWGRFLLLQIVDEWVLSSGCAAPIAYVKITKDTTLPTSIEQFNCLEYVQTWYTRYEERFWPIDMKCPQEDIAKKSMLVYRPDEYGFLPQYRVILLGFSRNLLTSKLKYLDNFANIAPPKNEFIPHSKDNISTVSLNKHIETFELKMIRRYCGHNLKELEIYTKTAK